MSAYQHWHLQRDEDGLVWAEIDKAGVGTNVLSAAVLAELGLILDALEKEAPRALIIRSVKSAGFVAGADIEEFSTLDTGEKGRNLVARGWTLFNRLAHVPYPTLALIQGHCLGGGLELALACRYRLLVEDPGTRLGLPEVMLGIFPGWGGMKRLPELIGPQAALDLMLTGKTVDARKARQLGLADGVVPPRVMLRTARHWVLSGKPAARAQGLKAYLNAWPLKYLVASKARQQVARKARQAHYPAPYAIVDFWCRYGGNALDAPELIDQIIASPTARNLVRVFSLQERLKGFGKSSSNPVKRVHVVGAGVMGGDIAVWCALRGMTVTLQDQNLERILPVLTRAQKLFSRRLKDARKVRSAMDRLIPDVAGDGVPHADVVIEAIFEDVVAKQSLLKDLESRMSADALLASNTSSLRLEDLRTGLAHPERLVGIHFFNPVAMMPLVEVVEAEGLNPTVTARACAFVRQIDKLPLPVKSAPGFLVNAVLAPYMLEAMRCVDKGFSPELIDEAMLAFGMPMGPLELVDTVGLDIAMAAGQQLSGVTTPPRCLADRVSCGHLGRKTGQGFYVWSKGKARKPACRQSVPETLAQRLVQPLMDRTQKLVEAGIVEDADLADAGVIFGTGFAPFTGGPLNFKAAYSSIRLQV